VFKLSLGLQLLVERELLEDAIANALGLTFVQALGLGALTGLVASGWHVVSK
jgi:hypothetical protein